jgi:hypothetical protein
MVDLFRLAALLPAVLLGAPCVAGPRAECATTRCDFGRLLPGVPPPAVFSITNRGDAPLVLQLQLCCGSVVTGADKPIAPGATGRLTVSLRSLTDGLLRKTLRVLTNDPDTPELPLELLADVRSPLQLLPSAELAFPLAAVSIDPQRVVLRCNDEPELMITSIRCSAPFLRCKEVAGSAALNGLNRVSVGIAEEEEPGRLRVLEVSVAPNAPAKPYEAVIVVSTNCKRRPEVKLRVFGFSPAAVTAQPPRIDFALAPGQEDAKQWVTLTRAVGPFKVLGATASDPRMEVRIAMDASGMFADLIATFRPGSQRGAFQGTITVRTDDPDRPRVLIPYAGEAH